MADERDSDAGVAAAAVDTAVRELASMLVIFGVSWAILHRDTLTRLYQRATRRPVSAARARELRLIAELRAAISRYEHAHDRAPTVAGDGLYGGR